MSTFFGTRVIGPRSFLSSTVKLTRCTADCSDERQDTELPRIPLSAPDHQPRRLALLPILPRLRPEVDSSGSLESRGSRGQAMTY